MTSAGTDLGISKSAGMQRSVGELNKRIRNGSRHAKRVGAMPRRVAKAKGLSATGVAPMQSYGAQAAGVSPSQLRALRRSAVQSLPPGGQHPWGATLFARHNGGAADPGVKVHVDQVKAWVWLWDQAS